MKRLKQIYKVIEIAIGIGACIGSGLLVIPLLFRIHPYIVLSGSMEPQIMTGSIVYIDKNALVTQLAEGDVIGYKTNGGMRIVHRITAIDYEKRCVRTKGDQNQAEDLNEISFEQIEGKAIISIPKVGYLIQWMQSRIGNTVIISGIGIFLCGSIFFERKQKRTGKEAYKRKEESVK